MYMRGFPQHNRRFVSERANDNRRAILIAMAIFAALSLWAGLKSDGFLEADACTHYQYARWAFADPSYFLNVWGRPICTGIYSIPAVFAGREGTKILSLLIALALALVSWRIARLQGYRWPALACIFLLAEPLVFLHSFSVLTELPFALLLGLTFWMYCQRRWLFMAILASFLPLARPEGFAFLVLAAVALLAHRRYVWLAILPIPILAWDLTGWISEGCHGGWWTWLPNHWPYAAQSIYQAGPIWHFVALLPVVVGPFLLPFVLIGIWKNLQHFSDHRQRCDALIALISLAVLAGHSYLYWRGKMASNGEVRYLLVVAPFWALLAARGWEVINWRWPFLLAGVASVLPIIANIIYPVVPLRFDPNWQEARHLVQWYESSPDLRKHYPRILAAHPGISYFLDVCPTDPRFMLQWSRQQVSPPPKGVVLIWDDVYSLYNADADLVVPRKVIDNAGWKLIRIDTDAYQHHWAIYLSPKSD